MSTYKILTILLNVLQFISHLILKNSIMFSCSPVFIEIENRQIETKYFYPKMHRVRSRVKVLNQVV